MIAMSNGNQNSQQQQGKGKKQKENKPQYRIPAPDYSLEISSDGKDYLIKIVATVEHGNTRDPHHSLVIFDQSKPATTHIATEITDDTGRCVFNLKRPVSESAGKTIVFRIESRKLISSMQSDGTTKNAILNTSCNVPVVFPSKEEIKKPESIEITAELLGDKPDKSLRIVIKPYGKHRFEIFDKTGKLIKEGETNEEGVARVAVDTAASDSFKIISGNGSLVLKPAAKAASVAVDMLDKFSPKKDGGKTDSTENGPPNLAVPEAKKGVIRLIVDALWN